MKYLKVLITFILLQNLSFSQEAIWKKAYDSLEVYFQNGSYSNAEKSALTAKNISEKTFGKNDARYLKTINRLADVYIKLSKSNDAKKYSEETIQLASKINNLDSLEYSAFLNTQADVFSNLFKYDLADSVAKLTLGIRLRHLPKDDILVAQTFHLLGDINRRIPDYEKSEKYLNQALEIREKILGSHNLDVAQTQNFLAIVYLSTNRYEESENLFKKALGIRESILGKENNDVAGIINNLAYLFEQTARYSESEQYYRKAIAIRENIYGPNHPNVGRTNTNLANLLAKQGKFQEAEILYKRSLNIFEKGYGGSHPLVANTLTALGKLYVDQGKYIDAEPMYERALKIKEDAMGPEHLELVPALSSLAYLYQTWCKFTEAESMMKRAISIFEKAYGRDHTETSKLLSNLAIIYSDQKKYSEAESLYKESLASKEKKFGANHPDVATSVYNLASFYCDQKKYSDAEPLFKRALNIRQKMFGPNHARVQDCLHSLAKLYFLQNNYEESDKYYDLDLKSLLNQFEDIFNYASEEDKMAFLEMVYDYFPPYFSFAYNYSKNNPEMMSKMYNFLLWQKGIVVSSTSEMFQNIKRSGDKESLLLLDELKSVREKIAKMNSTIPKDPEQYKKDLDILEKQAEEIEKTLSQKSSAFSKSKQMQNAKWSAIRDRLKDDEAAIEIVKFNYRGHWIKEPDDSVFYIGLVITKKSIDHPNLVFIGTEEYLANLVAYNYKLSVVEFPLQKTLQPKNELYNSIWTKFDKYLDGITKIYLSPDGMFNQFAFEVLVDNTGKYLDDRYEFRYVLSTKDILKESGINPDNKSVELFGDPIYLSEKVNSSNNGKDINSSISLYASFGPLSRLPGTKIEIENINKIFTDKKWRPIQHNQLNATEEILKKIKSPRVLHIATHGFFLSDKDIQASTLSKPKKHSCDSTTEVFTDPMLRSGLFFSGCDNKQKDAKKDDGILTAFEASNLDLAGTELVVLSACETGLGDVKSGEGVFGLRRAFQIAGSEAILMSLWSVPDKETQEMMNFFYKFWLEGKDKYTSFHLAQKEERKIIKVRYGKDLPYYWGAFIIVGR